MQRRGAATPKIVVYLVFASLIAAIVAFIAIGYFAYQKDMILFVKPVSISMHDPAALQAAFYQAKDANAPQDKAKDPKKGEIISAQLSSTKAGMSLNEELMWGLAALATLGVLAGLFVAFKMKRATGGKLIVAISAAALIVCIWQALVMANHRMLPYDLVFKVDTKGKNNAEPLKLLINDQTTIKINEKNQDAGVLKPGMRASVIVAPDKKTATIIESPIPDKAPRNGAIISLAPSLTMPSVASFTEQVVHWLIGAAGLIVIVGLLVIFKKHLITGISIALVGGIGDGVGIWQAMYLAQHRVPPYDVLIQPEAEGAQNPPPVKVITNSSTTVKIDGDEKDIHALKPGMIVSAVLSDDGKDVTSIISPVPENRKATLRLPAGFVGSPEHPAEPLYLSTIELKDEYLVQSFSVTKGAEIFRVDQVDRDPLGFTAFSRSLRLGALHDYRPAKILEEGPVLLPDIPPVKWLSGETNLFGRDVNAYALIVEGFAGGKAVRCRQIAIQGEGTMMYVIKATAPTAEWPRAGEVFDSAIATFKLAAAAPATQPATQESKTQPATATQSATQQAQTVPSAPATQPSP